MRRTALSRRSLLILFGIVSFVIVVSAPVKASPTETCFIDSANAARVAEGRPPLSVSADLTKIAREHSARMAADDTIYHNGHLEEDVGKYFYLGENVGMGPSCSIVHGAFMDSPGHKANILDKDFKQIGVGVVIQHETIFVTEIFFTAAKSVKSPTPSKPAAKKPPAKSASASPKPRLNPKPSSSPTPTVTPTTIPTPTPTPMVTPTFDRLPVDYPPSQFGRNGLIITAACMLAIVFYFFLNRKAIWSQRDS